MLETLDVAGRLALVGEFTIYHANEAKAVLLDYVASTAAPVLDLSKISEVDTSGIQVLLLAQREALRAGKSLKLAATSVPLAQTLSLLRLNFATVTPSK